MSDPTPAVHRYALRLMICLLVALPVGGSAASSLPPPTVTYLRSYRAPFGVPTRLAVDAAGTVYVADPGQGEVVVRAANGRIISRVNGLGRPVSIAVGASGRIYVGDGAAGRVTAFTSDWQPVLQLGDGAGEFQLPNDLAIDPATGNLYVADSPAHLVKVYTTAGTFLRSFGGQGSGDGQFNFPVGVFVDAAARQVVVVDQQNYRIEIFDPAGAFLSSFGTQGSGPGQFNMPQAVWVDAAGRVYVADSVEGHIQVLDRSGGFVGSIGDFGEGAGQLRIPMGMVVDPSNRLLVAAANNARLEMFGVDTFADPETFTPAVLHVEPNPIERTNPASTVVGYVEVPAYPLEQVVPGSIAANGVAVATTALVVGDHDGNGVPDARVEFNRAALLATLPVDGAGTITLSGTIAAKQFEGSAAVQITTCGPGATCSLSNADPQCNEAVCIAPTGCTIQAKTDGIGCEDGDACTVGDVCGGGTCVGTTLNCDDGNVCTDDGCDAVAGCTHTSNTAACNDANPCTSADTCADGVCSGTPLACDDGDACTDDSCDAASGCVHTTNTAPCSDGNACTVGDTCAGGVCSGALLGCDDGNVCTDDACDAASGCLHTNNAAPCNDANACTVRDACVAGVCRGTALGCDDGNRCTDDSCNSASGCAHRNNRASCDDSDLGTVRDACNGLGACTGQTVTGNYALLGWPLKSSGHRSVTLSTRALVHGDICGENVAVGSSSQIDGNTVAAAAAGKAIMLGPGSQLAGNVVTGGAKIVGLERVVVGGRVDQSGGATELTECLAARYRATARRAELAALAPTSGLALGEVELESGASRRIPSKGKLGTGQSVIEVTDLRLGASSTLTLVGTGSSSTLVMRVRGRMMLERAARIQLDGLRPEQVILVVDGSVTLQSNASIAGSVFAAGKVRMGAAGSISGALLGSDIDLAPYATVDLHPFGGW